MLLSQILYNPAINWVITLVILFYGPVLVVYLIFKLIGFQGYMSLFRFIEGKSIIYRMDPRTKILLSIIVTTVAAITIWWISAIMFVAVMALYALLSNIKEKLRVALPLILASFIGTAWTESIFAPYSYLQVIFHHVTFLYVFPQSLAVLGITQGSGTFYVPYLGYVSNPVGLTWEGIIYGLQITFRAVAAIASGLLLIFSTPPSDILRSLEKSGLPIELGFTLLLAVSSVPKVLENSMVVLNSLRARGVEFRPRSRNPIRLIAESLFIIRVIVMALVSIVILTLRDARQIAIAADIRAFRAYRRRTYYRDIRLGRIDYIAIALLIVLLIAGIYISGLPGMGAVPYNP
ncbi:energy-coupling factor transporter transmembrane component T family protein [Vulcanisaeta sp. JCM 14467]|uniref:energy-coupling factor transporter transmembrane component T family protein n=1 Tax=Vulcanisaeta sp. JCM 14467 TaxID=1295370 RepID=UPI0006D0AAAC|nr:energy-coupling factor transporter transmembrane component T [Vulcanisaeta sp. JCM 14467]